METIDDVVVGAGCGGVYAAWRLREDRPAATVRVLEASGRVGGRLESLTPPGAPHLRAEFGGMGFDTNHQLVEAVVDALSLPTAPFPSSGPAYAWLRGVPLLGSQLTDAAAVPYRLPPSEQGQSFAQLLAARVGEDLGIDAGTMTHADWLEVGRCKRVLGTPLRDIGFYNYLATILSAEGYAYVQDTMEARLPGGQFQRARPAGMVLRRLRPRHYRHDAGRRLRPAPDRDRGTLRGGRGPAVVGHRAATRTTTTAC